MVARPGNNINQVEYLQSIVGKYFPIYRTEVEYDIVNLYIRISPEQDIEKPFNDLRKELVPQNFIPHIREIQGEFILSVKAQPAQRYRGIKTNLIMLLITIGTTLIAGMWWWSSYDPQNGGFFTLYNLLNGGLYFTLPLMTILGIHEMGHYMMARYHGIKASLPFFIPFIPPLGTIGAFISIREPIPDKKSLLDLGVAGPICGFIVAVPVSILGIYLGTTMGRPVPADMEGTFMSINFPIIMQAISYIMPFPSDAMLHPTAFAGWIGFLVTGLNLLPAGQLDGGHVARALFGDQAKYASYAAAAFLVIVGIFWYPGWLMFALFIFFLVGLKHPPPLNDMSNLDTKRKAVGVFAVLLLLTCFHPIPVEQITYSHDFSLELIGEEPVRTLSVNESAEYLVNITNKGEPASDIYNVSYSLSNSTAWSARLYVKNETGWSPVAFNFTSVELEPDETTEFRLEVQPEEHALPRTDIEFKGVSENTGRERSIDLSVRLIYSFTSEVRGERVVQVIDGTATFEIDIINLGHHDIFNISTDNISREGWSMMYHYEDQEGESLQINLSAGSQVTFTGEMSSQENETWEFLPVYANIHIESQGTREYVHIEVIGVQTD